jgi:hypothetical protein
MLAPMIDELSAMLGRLDGVKRNGSGWTSKCPAHEDARASLSISEGDDGRRLAGAREYVTSDTARVVRP